MVSAVKLVVPVPWCVIDNCVPDHKVLLMVLNTANAPNPSEVRAPAPVAVVNYVPLPNIKAFVLGVRLEMASKLVFHACTLVPIASPIWARNVDPLSTAKTPELVPIGIAPSARVPVVVR